MARETKPGQRPGYHHGPTFFVNVFDLQIQE